MFSVFFQIQVKNLCKLWLTDTQKSIVSLSQTKPQGEVRNV